MSEATDTANGWRSKIRSRMEYVFAHQGARMGLFVRIIGIAKATMKIGIANIDTSGTRKERDQHDVIEGQEPSSRVEFQHRDDMMAPGLC